MDVLMPGMCALWLPSLGPSPTLLPPQPPQILQPESPSGLCPPGRVHVHSPGCQRLGKVHGTWKLRARVSAHLISSRLSHQLAP